MEGVPLFNQEDNSEDTGSEFGADGKPKKKSKKKSAPEWFQRIVNTGEEQPEEESRTGRLLDLIKSPFSKLFGVEKDELQEDVIADNDGVVAEEPEYGLSSVPGLYSQAESVEPDKPEAVDDPVDGEPELPQGLIIDEETAEEFAMTEIPAESERVEQVARESDSGDEVAAVGSGIHDSGELSVDQLRAEVEANAMASHEIPTERPYEVGLVDTGGLRTETAPQIKEREVIIEKRGGAGAAAVGFVAADLLSRSRDRKIRKEAKQLKKKVATLENKQKDDNFRAREVEAQNKERLRDLAEKREHDVRRQNEKNKSVAETQSPPPVAVQPERVVASRSTVERSDPVVERMSDYDQYQARQDAVSIEREPDDRRKAQEQLFARQKQELLATIEQAKVVPYAGETYYDRQHEVMDEPTQYDMASGGSITGKITQTRVTTRSQPDAPQTQQQPVPAYESLPQKSGLSDEYKQAIVQGAATGIILLVGFLVGLVIWSLL